MGRPRGVLKELSTTPAPEWLLSSEQIQLLAHTFRKEEDLASRDSDSIARSLARHIVPLEIRTTHRVEAVVANIGTLVMDENPYRIIDANDSRDGMRVLLTAYIDELHDRIVAEQELA